MGIHDEYGKKVLINASDGQFKHWFVEEATTLQYPTGGIVAKLDGIIADNCIVEIEALNEKQIRGGVLDLVFHARPKKLLVIIPANLNNQEPEEIQKAYQSLLDNLISRYCSHGFGKVALLKGSGHNPDKYFDEDCLAMRKILKALL